MIMFRGSVRVGATGAIAPVDFQKYQIAPIILEDGQGKNYMKYIQTSISKALVVNIIQNSLKILVKEDIL